jgi:hypothetical protein
VEGEGNAKEGSNENDKTDARVALALVRTLISSAPQSRIKTNMNAVCPARYSSFPPAKFQHCSSFSNASREISGTKFVCSCLSSSPPLLVCVCVCVNVCARLCASHRPCANVLYSNFEVSQTLAAAILHLATANRVWRARHSVANCGDLLSGFNLRLAGPWTA